MNMIAFLILYNKYKKSFGYSLFEKMPISLRLSQSTKKVPSIKEIEGKLCVVENNANEDREEMRKCKENTFFLTALILEIILEELEMTTLNFLDLTSDSVCLILYILWEGTDAGWLNWNSDNVYTLYDISWEVSTLAMTFLIFICLPTFTKKFLEFYSTLFYRCNKKLLSFFNKKFY
jgi:hypothetical protein